MSHSRFLSLPIISLAYCFPDVQTAALTASANETGSPPKFILINFFSSLGPQSAVSGRPISIQASQSASPPYSVPTLACFHGLSLMEGLGIAQEYPFSLPCRPSFPSVQSNCSTFESSGSSWLAYIEDTYWLEPEAKLVEDARKELVAFRSRLLQYWWLTIQHDKRQWTWGLG
ncbi:hypothetical protein C8J56DRAFT_1027204 [Mycena floridula]|nr:hypothetical protein C8J56DRAFT_1027204 [Mycena floridula]